MFTMVNMGVCVCVYIQSQSKQKRDLWFILVFKKAFIKKKSVLFPRWAGNLSNLNTLFK